MVGRKNFYAPLVDLPSWPAGLDQPPPPNRPFTTHCLTTTSTLAHQQRQAPHRRRPARFHLDPKPTDHDTWRRFAQQPATTPDDTSGTPSNCTTPTTPPTAPARPAGPAGPVRYCGRFTSRADHIRHLAATLPARRAIADAACHDLGWVR